MFKNIRFFITIIIILFFTLALATFFTFYQKPKKPRETTSSIFRVETEKEYRSKIRQIFRDYLEKENQLTPELINNFKKQLLALVVPSSLKQLHLDLVIAFNQIAMGLGGNKEKLAVGKLMIKEIKNKWRSYLFPISPDEILVKEISGDTNNDNSSEILLVTKKVTDKGDKFRFLILDHFGQKLYDQSDILIGPQELELKRFEEDPYFSYYLSLKEGGYYIRWNGREYMIPEE